MDCRRRTRSGSSPGTLLAEKLVKYVEFAAPSSHIKLALYGRRALAKDVGVSPDGTGSHQVVLACDGGPFTDPDGFAWEAASLTPTS